MNISTYRKYIVCSNRLLSKKKVYWDYVKKTVPHLYLETLSYNTNHPLVFKGLAFWENPTTLITGYILKNNPNIFRPIYSHEREIKIIEMHIELKKKTRIYINIIKKKIETKQLYNQLYKIKILPINIIIYNILIFI